MTWPKSWVDLTEASDDSISSISGFHFVFSSFTYSYSICALFDGVTQRWKGPFGVGLKLIARLKSSSKWTKHVFQNIGQLSCGLPKHWNRTWSGLKWRRWSDLYAIGWINVFFYLKTWNLFFTDVCTEISAGGNATCMDADSRVRITIFKAALVRMISDLEEDWRQAHWCPDSRKQNLNQIWPPQNASWRETNRKVAKMCFNYQCNGDETCSLGK